jgi:DNA-binding protein H-NS
VTSGHAAKVRQSKDLSTKSHEDMAAVFGMRISEFQQYQQVTITSASGSTCDEKCSVKEDTKKSKRSIKIKATVEVCYEKSSKQVMLSSGVGNSWDKKYSRKEEMKRSRETAAEVLCEKEKPSMRQKKKRKM